jgi:hypothetical protein
MPDNLPSPQEPVPGLVLYQSPDGTTRFKVRLDQETLWLTQRQLADLFQKDVRTVSEHIQNVFAEGELPPEATIRKYRIVQTEGGREVERLVDHYSLDVVIAVGYRVRSHRGTQFRQWATQRLREYLVKGFTLDDERLKKGGKEGTPDYFDELLARIRDIRSSEKVFWRKVLDIYATSVDYDPANDQSALFFKTVQNKMHWAAHGHTAAEVIAGFRAFRGEVPAPPRAAHPSGMGHPAHAGDADAFSGEVPEGRHAPLATADQHGAGGRRVRHG